MGGGKGQSTPAPAYAPPPSSSQEMDYTPMIKMMGDAMLMASSLSKPINTPPPAIKSAPTIDWGAKQNEIAKQSQSDVQEELRKRRGRASTVLTSPLVNEEDPTTVAAKPSGVK